MKLIFCPKCSDVVKLSTKGLRRCECGKASGQYEKDGLNATISGTAIPLGFANSSLTKALQNRPENGLGQTFEAFVIPKTCPTIKEFRATVVECATCKKCGDIIYSRATHDMRWCSCASIAIDGGRDYTKLTGHPENYKTGKVEILATAFELAQDWNMGTDRYGKVPSIRYDEPPAPKRRRKLSKS
jgi:hypothetical protein